MTCIESLRPYLDAVAPDWSGVSLHQVHNALNDLIKKRRSKRRRSPSRDDVEFLNRSGNDIQKLLEVQAMKWAEKGIGELRKKREQIRSRVGDPSLINPYDDILLQHLDREYEKLVAGCVTEKESTEGRMPRSAMVSDAPADATVPSKPEGVSRLDNLQRAKENPTPRLQMLMQAFGDDELPLR